MPTGAERVVALDTSIAVALLVQTHTAHEAVVEWWSGRPVALSGHALVETYSVLTRLPGDLRLPAHDAARLLGTRFEPPLLLDPGVAVRIPDVLAEIGVAGGATYDALVALAAAHHGCVLATRDARARGTYDAVGVEVAVVV